MKTIVIETINKKIIGKKIAYKRISKNFLSKDKFLFNFGKNLVIIDLIIKVDFSNFFLYYLLYFYMINKSYFLTP